MKNLHTDDIKKYGKMMIEYHKRVIADCGIYIDLNWDHMRRDLNNNNRNAKVFRARLELIEIHEFEAIAAQTSINFILNTLKQGE